MNSKKVFLLLFSLVFMSLFSGIVFASNHQPDIIPDIVEDFFGFLFVQLPEEARQGSDLFLIYFKVILWLLLYAVFYWGAKKVFADNPRIAGVVSLLFAGTAVILIPGGILIFLFTEFSAIVTILLAFVPLFIGIMIRRNIPAEHQTMRNLLMGIVGIVALFVGGYFVAFEATGGPGEGLYQQLGQYSTFGGAIAIIWAIVGIFTGVQYGGGERGAGAGGKGDEGGRGGDGDKEIDADERRAREQTEDEQKMLKRILGIDINSLKTDVKIRDYLEDIRDSLNTDEFMSKKLLVMRKIRSVKNWIINMGKRNYSVKKMIEGNKTLFAQMSATMDDLNDDTREALRRELRKKPGRNIDLYNRLIDDARVVDNKLKIDNFLTHKITTEDTARIGFLGEINTKLAEVITELNKANPSLEDVEESLGNVIDMMTDNLIPLDADIVDREKEMYRNNQFIEKILNVPAITGP